MAAPIVVVAMKEDLEVMEAAAAASSHLTFVCPRRPQAAAGKCKCALSVDVVGILYSLPPAY